MATIVKFTYENSNYPYYWKYDTNVSGDCSGDYVSLADYQQLILEKNRDITNLTDQLAAYSLERERLQTENTRLREALESIAHANLTTQSNDIWVDEAQMIIIAQKALND